MKKIMVNIIFVGLISILILPLCVSAKNITKLETTAEKGKMIISGTTESGVLAVAAFVYSGSDLVYMQTCEADGSAYSCALNNDFATGNYVVKVADYDGGDYVVDNISITNKTDNNPKTSDTIMNSIVIGGIVLVGLIGTIVYTKKDFVKNSI